MTRRLTGLWVVSEEWGSEIAGDVPLVAKAVVCWNIERATMRTTQTLQGEPQGVSEKANEWR